MSKKEQEEITKKYNELVLQKSPTSPVIIFDDKDKEEQIRTGSFSSLTAKTPKQN